MTADRRARSASLDRAVGREIFGADAAAYDAGRLAYPAGLYDRVFARVGRPSGLSVLEVGAGTGLATRDLLARSPAHLLAIEPDSRLAAYLAEALARDSPGLVIENRPFESVELARGSFDLVAAAASFHWLEPVSALARIHTALKARGVLAVWWNVYRAKGIGDPFADAVTPMLDGIALPPYEGEERHHALDSVRHRELLEGNGFENVEFGLFRRERTLDAKAVRALYSTYSFVRCLDAPARARLLDQIAALVATEFGGRAPNVVLTPFYVATKRG